MPFSLNRLTALPPAERMAYVCEHIDEIRNLTQRQKDRVGTLLCHASPPEVRKESPIISDLRSDPVQELFEKHVASKGPHAAREIALGKANGKNS